LAITPSSPPASRPSSQAAATSGSRVAGEIRKPFGSFSSSRRRFSSGSSWTGFPFQSRTSNATNCAGISEAAAALDHDLAVERRVGREEIAERPELREVAQQRPAVAAPEGELAAVVLQNPAEAVPLRLVLPVAVGQLADQLGLHRGEGDVLSGHARQAR
jgi:hypothetical protein